MDRGCRRAPRHRGQFGAQLELIGEGEQISRIFRPLVLFPCVEITVHGGAHLLAISMDHRSGQSVVVESGSRSLQGQGVRDEVCRVMEGGRQAFERRYRRLLQETGDA